MRASSAEETHTSKDTAVGVRRIGRSATREVIHRTGEELADMVPRLPVQHLQRLLEDDVGDHERVRVRAAKELSRRPEAQNYALWQILAGRATECSEVRAMAVRVLANAPGYWPLSEHEVCDLLRNGGYVLRDAIVEVLPRVYPLGIPVGVVESLVHGGCVSRFVTIAEQLGPIARGGLVAQLVRLVCDPVTRNRPEILTVLQNEGFRHVPGELLSGVWDCLHDDAHSIRRCAARVVINRGRGWLAPATDTLLARATGESVPRGSQLPVWLVPHLRRALEPRSNRHAFSAAMRVVARFGNAATDPELIPLLTPIHLDHRCREIAIEGLCALGYFIDCKGGAVRAASFARTLGC